jgi:hypothetical protein
MPLPAILLMPAARASVEGFKNAAVFFLKFDEIG